MKISLTHWDIHRSSRNDWELGWSERDGIAFLAMERGSESLKSEFGMFGNKKIYFSGAGMSRSLGQFVGRGLQR